MDNGSTASHIVDISEQNIREQVLEASNTVPVLIDVWADWCEPCKALTPILEKLAQEYAGRFILAKLNADEQQGLAAQLGIRSLPTLKLIVQGQIVGELTGLQPEGEIRKMLDQHIPKSPQEEIDELLEKIEQLRSLGELEKAKNLLRHAINSGADSELFKAVYADVLLECDEADDAKAIMDSLAIETREGPWGKRYYCRLKFRDKLEHIDSLEDLQKQLQQDPENLQLQFSIAHHVVVKGQYDEALEIFWRLFSQHRDFQADEVRLDLLALLDLLGKKDPRANAYRKKMFNLMH